MTDEKSTLRQLEELARRNGRTLARTGRTADDGQPILVTFERWGDDPAEGTPEALLEWERGYIPPGGKKKRT